MEEGLGRLLRAKGRARLAMVGGLVVALVLVVTGALALLVPSQAAGAQSSLTVLTGDVQVSDESGSFGPAADGSLLNPGVTIRTGKDANAVVTFFDGSTVTIEPESELTLDQVEATSRGDVLISMTQKIGKTWHVIAHRLTGASHYKLKTPSATASVRGTAFRSAVGEHVTALETVDGVVSADLAGKTVDIGEGQVCPLGHKLDGSELPPGATPPPSFDAVPLPAPPPAAVAKIVIDPSQASSATATTKDGLSVGFITSSGVTTPVRYAPGSKVEKVGDKLVMSIPLKDPGRISTVVKAVDPSVPVGIQTQIQAKDQVIASLEELRQANPQTGIAKGGFVTTDQGVLLLPTKEADMFTAANIGKTPAVPIGQLPLFAPGAAKPDQILLAPPGGNVPPVAISPGTAPGFLQGQAFQGGFQPYQSLGSAAQSQSGILAPSAQNFVNFADLPPQIAQQLSQFIPQAPPGAKDLSKVTGFELPAGVTFPPIPAFSAPPISDPQGAPAIGSFPPAQGIPFAGFPGQGLPFSSAFPFSSSFPGVGQGINPFAGTAGGGTIGQGATSGGQTGQGGELPANCAQTPFGVICSNASAATGGAQPASPGSPFPGSIPPCAPGQQSTATAPCIQPAAPPGASPGTPGFGGTFQQCAPGQQPTATNPCIGGAGASPGAGFTTFPPCAEGQVPTATNPCTPTGGGGAAGTCTPPEIPLPPDGKCGTPPTTTTTCTAPLVPLPGGGCGTAPTTTTCTAPQVLLPDGKCGTPTTTTTQQCPAGTTGTYPNCTSTTTQQCPAGTTGTYPNCTSTTTQQCPAGTTGTYPNCSSTDTSGAPPPPPPPPPGDTSGAPPPPPPPPPPP